MSRRDLLFAGIVLALVVVLGVVWVAPTGLKRAPDITLTTLSGEQLPLQSLRGRPLLVTFWATTCSGCIKEIPHLVDLHNDFAARGLTIVGIAMSYDPPNRVLDLATRRQLPYTIALDIDGAAARAFGNVRLTPTNFLVDRDGRIVRQKIGEFSDAELNEVRGWIQQVLGAAASWDDADRRG